MEGEKAGSSPHPRHMGRSYGTVKARKGMDTGEVKLAATRDRSGLEAILGAIWRAAS